MESGAFGPGGAVALPWGRSAVRSRLLSEVVVEFADVVAGGHERPFRLCCLVAAEGNVFAALDGVDLAEYGLDDCFAAGVVGLAWFGSEFAGHPLFRCGGIGDCRWTRSSVARLERQICCDHSRKRDSEG